MHPTVRLTWRLAPYMVFTAAILLLVLLTFVALFIIEFQPASLFPLLGTIYLVVIWKMLIPYMSGTVLAKELKERAGKPIKVLRPGKQNFHFLKSTGWGYEMDHNIAIFVNPRQDKFTLTKYLYMLDPSSESFSDQLLEVAATNEKAFEEVSSKFHTGKYRASNDLRKYETASLVSDTIQDIVK